MVVNESLVFVYGTLMRGERYHMHLAPASFAGETKTAAAFELFDLGPYPAMVAGQTSVTGELYRVDQVTLATLDELEGHPTYYSRRTIALADGRRAIAYLFVDDPDGAAIPSGDWRKR